jgi:hypothetical protein
MRGLGTHAIASDEHRRRRYVLPHRRFIALRTAGRFSVNRNLVPNDHVNIGQCVDLTTFTDKLTSTGLKDHIFL